MFLGAQLHLQVAAQSSRPRIPCASQGLTWRQVGRARVVPPLEGRRGRAELGRGCGQSLGVAPSWVLPGKGEAQGVATGLALGLVGTEGVEVTQEGRTWVGEAVQEGGGGHR